MNPETVRAEATRLVRAGKTIEAVKFVRDQMRLGVKDAKSLVDSLPQGGPPMPPSQLEGHTHTPLVMPPVTVMRSNAEQPPASNFLLLLVIAVLVAVLVYLYFTSPS